MTQKKAKPGRRKELDTPGWKSLSVLLPQEVWRALRRLSFEEERRQAALIRELLEKHLEAKGFLKVSVKKDAEGHEVRSYHVVE